MTERLYDQDPYLKRFDAVVTACWKDGEGYRVYVDRTAFFPEGGGQSGDRGVLTLPGKAVIRVLDTQEDGDEVYLLTNRPLQVGDRVCGEIDWRFRFDRMQNHTGEHIVSGLVHKHFGYENVGFHMREGSMTIDLSGPMEEEDLREIERKANEVVWADLPVLTAVYTEEEARGVQYRSKKDLHGVIRVVTIPGADACACCGTHVKTTGQIGPVLLISHERFRGGTRIEMTCGRWAYDYQARILDQNRQVSSLVSARPLETAAGVGNLLESTNSLKAACLKLQYGRMDQIALEMTGQGDLLLFADFSDFALVEKLAAKVLETCGGKVFVLAGTDREGYRYACGQKEGNLIDLVKDLNQTLNGRGGGRPYFQQGALQASRDQIEGFLREKMPNLSVKDL